MTGMLSDPVTLLLLIAICSVRTAVALLMLPMLATTIVPALVRGALGLSLMVPIVAANVEKPLQIEFAALPILLLFLRESAVGVVIGLGYGAFCAGLQAVGEIIDHQTGLTFTQNLDPVRGNNVSVTSILLQTLFFAALMYSGFLLLVTDTIYLSFEVWPIGQVMPSFAAGIPLRLVSESSRLFSLALLLSGPVVLVLFVIDAGAGMLNRAAPQLHVNELTLSLKSIVGLGVLAASLPTIIERSVFVMREVALSLRSMLN
jgi:type III secretion protein T